MTYQSSTLSILSLALLSIFLASSSSVNAFAPTPTAVNTRHQSQSTSSQLSAWSIPAPGQRGGSHWYQDCGTAIQRNIEYNDLEDWRDDEDSFGLGFARLRFMNDDSDMRVSFPQDQNEVVETTESFPKRVIRGIWNRVRGIAQ